MTATAMGPFQAIDCFDEESCRSFLREIGARVVPNYPFSYGMEEVNSLIMEEYGYEGVPDVLSVLQDLLEEEDSASGFGDDGDVWRQWRHRWRHRNDNELDPWVAKVGTCILPLPTSKGLRRIRADNFLRQVESEQSCHLSAMLSAYSKESPPLPFADRTPRTRSTRYTRQADGDCGEWLTSATYSHQRCRYTLSARSRNDKDPSFRSRNALSEEAARQSTATNDADSQQDFAEVTASMLHDGIDASWLLSFEMIEPGTSLPLRQHSLRGGHAPICTLQAVDTEPALLAANLVETKEEPACSNNSCQDVPLNSLQDGGDNVLEEHRFILEGCDGQEQQNEAEAVPCSSGVAGTGLSNAHHPGNTTYITPTQTPEPRRRRTAHRHARLIDGFIFPFKNRKSDGGRSSVDVQEHLSPDVGRRSLFRLSWTPTRHNSQSRRSWLQGLKSIFRTSQNAPRKPFARHRHNSSLGTIAGARVSMPQPHQTLSHSISCAAKTSNQHNLGLDGAYDELPSPSSSPLNKPLPLTPYEIAHSLSSGIPSKSDSVSRAQTLSYQPTSASTSSTTISKTSSKSEFRAIAKDLLSSKQTTMHHPELSPVREVGLDPLKYDPLKSPHPPQSPACFSSLASRNPFTEDVELLTLRPRKSVDEHRHAHTSSYHSYGLPPSQSEPNLRPVSPIKPLTAAYYSPPNLPQTPPPSSPDRSWGGQGSSRGRSKTRLTAQEEHLFVLDAGDIPSKKSKRSRSPMKRLLGIGRTSPTKEPNPSFVQEPKTPVTREPKTPTTTGTKKSSLKQWSDRFRHGFLSVDQDELRREAEIEEYMKDSPEPEPPSSFPISLDPAYQARLQADIELLICVSANKFLLREAQAGRISKDTVNRARRSWEAKNLPQVLEYHFDQATQRDLILANFRTVQFQGQFANDYIALNSAMLSWGTLAKEMSVRTFCTADSAIKKQLHDAQRVIDMLGSPLVTCLAFEQLHVKALAMMNKAQKDRFLRKQAAQNGRGHSRNVSDVSKTSRSQHGPYPRRDYSEKSTYLPLHKRNLSEGSFGEIKGATEESLEDKIRNWKITPAPPPQLKVRKTTGASGVVSASKTSSPSPSKGHRYNGSLGGRPSGH